jgi:retinol dehydrogenase-12
MSKPFSSKTTAEQVADKFAAECTGKTVLVTGANSGLGFETCRVLAAKGARIILACRNQKFGEESVDKLKKSIPSADVHFLRLDLGDIKSIQVSVDDFNSRFDKLDILVNNAGVMACPKTMTSDGLEMQFAVNHLGHFMLTKLLLPVLIKSGTKERPSRVINLSSMAQMVFSPHVGILFDDLNADKSYHDGERYGQSKLAN